MCNHKLLNECQVRGVTYIPEVIIMTWGKYVCKPLTIFSFLEFSFAV